MSFQTRDGKKIAEPLSAIDYFSKNLENNRIITMCKNIDDLLGGGFPCGKITEICGLAGSGKSQICFQSSITVQIPKILGGMGGEAIYIDTEGSFNPQRLLLMAKYTINHCRKLTASKKFNENQLKQIDDFNVDKILDSIFYIRCTELKQLLSLSFRLHDMCIHKPNVRLILLDSIASLFRDVCDDIPKRNRILGIVGQNLNNIATQFGIAVVLTNQMTTKFTDNIGYAVPALGDSWGHISHIRMQLDHAPPNGCARIDRKAVLLKHFSQKLGSAMYQITIGGIRDSVS